MKKYIIKTISTATENNKSYAGKTATYYHGKGQSLLGTDNDNIWFSWNVKNPSELPKYLVEEHGYNRKCDAARSWILNNPENSEFWTSTTEIVEVEI